MQPRPREGGWGRWYRSGTAGCMGADPMGIGQKAQLWRRCPEKGGGVQRRAVRDIPTPEKKVAIMAFSDICQACSMCLVLSQALYWLYLTIFTLDPRCRFKAYAHFTEN